MTSKAAVRSYLENRKIGAERKGEANMDESHILRDCLVTASLLLGAVYLNWLGMGPPARTVGRLLGISGYLLLSAILIFWVISRLYQACRARKRREICSAVIGLLALALLFVWPFTGCHGRLDDLVHRRGRENIIAQWQKKELSQIGSQSYWVGSNSWDRRMYVTDGMFIFDAYNGFLCTQEILYSSRTPTGRWSGATPLGNGWYCWTGCW